jgi:hypothetical protein
MQDSLRDLALAPNAKLDPAAKDTQRFPVGAQSQLPGQMNTFWLPSFKQVTCRQSPEAVDAVGQFSRLVDVVRQSMTAPSPDAPC